MRKTVYLSYDLSKELDRKCYEYLISLGRSKKSVINSLLRGSGLLPREDFEYHKSFSNWTTKKEKKTSVSLESIGRVTGTEQIMQIPSYEVPDVQDLDRLEMAAEEKVTPIITSTVQETVKKDSFDISLEEAQMMMQIGAMFQTIQS